MTADVQYHSSSRLAHRGRPAVSMVASRHRLTSISIQANWPETVAPSTISDEILWCAEQVRAQRPRVKAWGNYSQYSIVDLEFQHDRHVRTLIEQASYLQ